ncbi:hypothetical protein [Burkholderia sp. JKS000303]|uniref:hypothetical protein n=1 Tax=Burkholderia sp. JKS000303 TaxID=1938747 RepID=UPI00117FD06F|nr:hypothetical protein [Burkholderia sp. JKS000303]
MTQINGRRAAQPQSDTGAAGIGQAARDGCRPFDRIDRGKTMTTDALTTPNMTETAGANGALALADERRDGANATREHDHVR